MGETSNISLLTDFLKDVSISEPNGTLFYILLCDSKETAEFIFKDMSYFVEYITIPKLRERSIKERILFTLKFFQKQCNMINKPIKIGKNCLCSFVAANYINNLYSLKVEVYHACKSAYVNDEDN